jgi:hypothetical protein
MDHFNAYSATFALHFHFGKFAGAVSNCGANFKVIMLGGLIAIKFLLKEFKAFCCQKLTPCI